MSVFSGLDMYVSSKRSRFHLKCRNSAAAAAELDRDKSSLTPSISSLD